MATQSDRPTVSTQILVHIVERAAARGVNPAPLLRDVGIDASALGDIDRMEDLAAYVRFFERAAVVVRDPHFGLHVARLNDVGALGALSFLFMSAPTLREAFSGFIGYLKAMQGGTRMELNEHGSTVHFEYQLQNDAIAPRRQDAEYSIAATYRLVDQYISGQFKPREIYFEHDRVGSYDLYACFFGCDVFFGRPMNTIVFDKAILETRSPQLSTRLYPIIASHLRAAMDTVEASTSLVDLVAKHLTDERLSGRVRIEDIARSMGMTSTVLARRLAREGASFREVLLSRRMRAAERLLRDSRRPIGEIALDLGYAENASFTHGFRRHFGLTPEQYRRGLSQKV